MTPTQERVILNWIYIERAHLREGNCYLGQLTSHGLKQMEEIGAQIRQKYVETTPLLPPTFDPNKIYIRSTNTKRTIETAYQIIQGLYPLSKYRSSDGMYASLISFTTIKLKF